MQLSWPIRNLAEEASPMIRVRSLLTGAALLGAALFGGTALAANDPQLPKGWQACQKEVAQYCPSAATSDDIFQCIESREKLGKKESGLSHACYEAHEKFESRAHEREEHESK